MNVSHIIKRHVEENPGKTAIIFGDRRISYAELDNLIARTADGLLKIGLERGDVLSLFLPSLPELIIGYLGTVRAGLTVNVVNAMLREQEVAYILKDCQTRAVLVDDSRLPIIEAVRPDLDSLEKIILLGDTGKDRYPSFDSVLAQESDRFDPVETKGSDLCHLMYTSGTTGWPKGVMATHLNIWHNCTQFGRVHFTPDDITMVATPIFHCWGLINGTFGTLSRGGTVITVERFYPEQALDTIERLRPTVFQGVPPMYNLFLKQPGLAERDISSVIFCLSAATKMPENLIRQIEERLNWRYAEAWGLTESSCVGTTVPYTETRIGSCGRGMDDAQIKVVDDAGNTLPPGEQGELCVKGTCVTNGYLNKPEATAEVFDPDGWFHAGDIAYMDEDGYAYIVDRKKDMINVGGEKVFPSEVEDMMLIHPKIRDLVIVGIPDELKGEAPKAFIQLNEGEQSNLEEIRAFCKPRMAPYKVPVAVEFVDEIPRSAAGKALRRLLREREWGK
ncbi:MAG: AMP-binding protein [Proteobacteria bacterium]|nr:AMP-binding protein [Desulfobacterales bacterium]MBL6966825.1 AMP-binding protein [Desulfobacteraceae bacterium]MBL7172233.1 AMP-binding protein [Desulfobacteraceae bacterium]MBU0735917.1 AMP-binding protein [Pseudomonadota bacterium]MBU1902363.1 AMP-binding protein [Pseudomonadota bacterium]